MDYQQRFPALFEPIRFGPTLVRFEMTDGPPDEALISNVMIVPYTPQGWVAIRTSEFGWGFPGGTLEEGETWREGLDREAMEEAGAEVISFQPFAIHRFEAKVPYRPHLPFPQSVRLIGHGEVRLVATPTPVHGGETILEVVELPHHELVAAISLENQAAADLLTIAAEVRDSHRR